MTSRDEGPCGPSEDEVRQFKACIEPLPPDARKALADFMTAVRKLEAEGNQPAIEMLLEAPPKVGDEAEAVEELPLAG